MTHLPEIRRTVTMTTYEGREAATLASELARLPHVGSAWEVGTVESEALGLDPVDGLPVVRLVVTFVVPGAWA